DTKTRPRLLREKNEEDSDYDWNAHRIFSGVDPKYPANIDHIKRIIEDEKGKSNKHILYFDEATFSSVEVLEEVKEICRENNIFFLGAGLNAGFLANKLPVMSHIEVAMKEEDLYECHAYTVFQDLALGPVGTHTARAIKYKGNIYPDGLALPLLVTKEKPYIVYGAATAEHHATTSMITEKDKQILMLQHRLAGITVDEIHNIQRQVSSGETLSWYHKLVLEVVNSQTKLQRFLELDAQEAA
ncbi:hypothetical protein KC678_01970, partial [Candidatus Dojkabacteria bacterium]|nr:hypothetical protein [Candidatus Dojkabacteria bacterium]